MELDRLFDNRWGNNKTAVLIVQKRKEQLLDLSPNVELEQSQNNKDTEGTDQHQLKELRYSPLGMKLDDGLLKVCWSFRSYRAGNLHC